MLTGYSLDIECVVLQIEDAVDAAAIAATAAQIAGIVGPERIVSNAASNKPAIPVRFHALTEANGTGWLEGALPRSQTCLTAEGHEMRYETSASADGYHMKSPGWISLTARPHGIDAFLHDQTPTELILTLATEILNAAMEFSGQALIHAALLQRRDGTYVALLAKSGTGKSTTALALARRGLPLAADDTIVAQGAGTAGSAPVSAWGLQSRANIHRKTAEFLPFLRPILRGESWNAFDEISVPVSGLPQVGIHLARQSPAPVSALVLLERRTVAGQSSVERCDPLDILGPILEDNISAPGGLFLPGSQRRFDLLTRLAGQSECIVARLGADVEALAAKLYEQLC